MTEEETCEAITKATERELRDGFEQVCATFDQLCVEIRKDVDPLIGELKKLDEQKERLKTESDYEAVQELAERGLELHDRAGRAGAIAIKRLDEITQPLMGVAATTETIDTRDSENVMERAQLEREFKQNMDRNEAERRGIALARTAVQRRYQTSSEKAINMRAELQGIVAAAIDRAFMKAAQ